jgi:hypothetical protein
MARPDTTFVLEDEGHTPRARAVPFEVEQASVVPQAKQERRQTLPDAFIGEDKVWGSFIL